MVNKKLTFLIAIFITLVAALSLVIAYQEEIENKAQQIFEKHFQGKIDNLSPEDKEQFEDFKKRDGADKFVSLIVKKNSDAGANDE